MEKRFVSTKELAEYTGLAIQTIYHWVQERRIPFMKIGRLVKFDLREVEKFLNSFRIDERVKNNRIFLSVK